MTGTSGSMREWTAAQRRARLVQRHHLSVATRAGSSEAIAKSLVAIHSSDPATVYLSVAARLNGNDPVASVERAIYSDRTLVRMHGMRKTIFVFPKDLASAIHTSTTSGHAVKLRSDFLKDLALGNATWDDAWLTSVEAEVLAHLGEVGEASGIAISRAISTMRQNIVYGAGTTDEVAQGIASRVLRGLGNDNRIARGRPIGSWISGQYRWSIALPHDEVAIDVARRELVRRWLATYGPGTLNDLKWWTGWAMRDVKSALADLDLEEVQLGEGIGYVLEGDAEPDAEAAPDPILLPGLDSTAMGYRHRDFYLDRDYVPALFDYSGNVGPTIWWGGQIVGGWAQRKDGEISCRWLANVPFEAEVALQREIERLRGWIGPIRITPRFWTPLERELVAV